MLCFLGLTNTSKSLTKEKLDSQDHKNEIWPSFLAKYAPKLAKFEKIELAHACSWAVMSFAIPKQEKDFWSQILLTEGVKRNCRFSINFGHL